MKTRDYESTRLKEDKTDLPKVTTPEDYEKIKSGEMYFDTEIGKPVRKK
jgi:hypothetical protein